MRGWKRRMGSGRPRIGCPPTDARPPGHERHRPEDRRERVEHRRAPAHHPRKDRGGERPQGRSHQQRDAQQDAATALGGARHGRRPVAARRDAATSSQAPQQGAGAPASELAGERGKGARETDEAERGREQRRRAMGSGPAHQQHQRQRRAEDEQRNPGWPAAICQTHAASVAAIQASRAAVSQPVRSGCSSAGVPRGRGACTSVATRERARVEAVGIGPAPPGRLEGASERRAGSARAAPPGRASQTVAQTVARARRAARAASRAARDRARAHGRAPRASSRGRSRRWRSQRRQRLADAPRRGGRRGAAHGIDAAERLVEHERERVEVGAARRPRRRRSARGPCRRACRARRRCGSGTPRRRAARRRSRSAWRRERHSGPAGAPGPGGGRRAGTSTFWGLMSRWITPRPCACRSASVSATPISSTSSSHERLGGDQLGEGLAVDQLGDQVEGVLLGARLVQGDDRGMGETGGGERLAVARSRSSPAGSAIALTATSRSSSSSWARHTTPKPPAPRRSSSR